jgi:hypothetical protein
MIDLTTLQNLRDRVAKATGPDREMDVQIMTAILPKKLGKWEAAGHYWQHPGGDERAPNLTSSIDAARVLVNRVLPGMVIECAIYPEGGGYACLWPWFKRALPMGHRGETEAGAVIPALAIILAMLDALIAKEKTDV